ncbi:MAG TPA: hypothetical protein VLT47_00945 [Anaeromyxobacteraceae bacterium]|nr:hypothetical protein [Anaeromyxobacteraceae bacterium]
MKAAFAFAESSHARVVIECRDGAERVVSLNGAVAERWEVEEACARGCESWTYSRGARVMMCWHLWPGDGPGIGVPGWGELVAVAGSGGNVTFTRVRKVFHSEGRKKPGARWRLGAFPAAPLEPSLRVAARDLVPARMTQGEMEAALEWGVWDGGRSAFAASWRGATGSVVVVFLRKPAGGFTAVDVSDVEGGNLGKLGRPRAAFERVETAPVKATRREDGRIEVEVRTRAWRQGRRHTVTELLLLDPDGTVLWR